MVNNGANTPPRRVAVMAPWLPLFVGIWSCPVPRAQCSVEFPFPNLSKRASTRSTTTDTRLDKSDGVFEETILNRIRMHLAVEAEKVREKMQLKKDGTCGTANRRCPLGLEMVFSSNAPRVAGRYAEFPRPFSGCIHCGQEAAPTKSPKFPKFQHSKVRLENSLGHCAFVRQILQFHVFLQPQFDGDNGVL